MAAYPANLTLLFQNNAVGTMASGISATATTIQLQTGQGANFPTPTTGQAAVAVLQNGSSMEVILITNNAGNVLTVTRGQEGTTPLVFALGSIVEMRITAGILASLLQGSYTGSSSVAWNTATAAAPNNALPLSQAQTMFAPLASGIPSGMPCWWTGTTAPTGYLIANGAAVSRTAYPALFAAINTTYGAGDGATTFNLPDLRGVSIRGLDLGRGYDMDAATRTIGSYQADGVVSHTHALNWSDLGHNHPLTDPGHTHPLYDPGHHHTFTGYGGGGGNGNSGSYTAWNAVDNTSTAYTGITIASATTGITIASATTGITASIVATGQTENTVKNVALLPIIKI